jgi:hypothetical protein
MESSNIVGATGSAVSVTQTTIDHAPDNADLLDDAVVELGGAPMGDAALASPQPRVAMPAPLMATQDETKKMLVIIWFSDPATGGVTSIRCTTSKGRVVSGVLETDPDHARPLISAVCEEGSVEMNPVATITSASDPRADALNDWPVAMIAPPSSMVRAGPDVRDFDTGSTATPTR